jgi:hypothetical protein
MTTTPTTANTEITVPNPRAEVELSEEEVLVGSVSIS